MLKAQWLKLILVKPLLKGISTQIFSAHKSNNLLKLQLGEQCYLCSCVSGWLSVSHLCTCSKAHTFIIFVFLFIFQNLQAQLGISIAKHPDLGEFSLKLNFQSHFFTVPSEPVALALTEGGKQVERTKQKIRSYTVYSNKKVLQANDLGLLKLERETVLKHSCINRDLGTP